MFVPEVVGVEVGAAGVSAEVSAGACNVAVRVVSVFGSGTLILTNILAVLTFKKFPVP